MNKWKVTTIGDCSTVLGDGLHGTPKYTSNGEYAFINGNNLREGKIIIKPDTKRVDEGEYRKYKKDLNERTVLVSINGTLGNVATYNGEKVILGKSACYFNVVESCDVAFMKYVVSSPQFQQYLQSIATGTTIKNVSLKQMREYEFLIPDLETQQKIASVLKSLDDKIALNNKINDNLEQQTQALYQKYFPETDNAGKLADLCNFSKDKIAVSELSVRSYFSTENMLSDKKGTTEAANLPAVEQTTACHIGSVLVSNIRPYFKKILYCQCEGGCSVDVLCFVPKIPELSAYLYCTLYADKFFDFMVAGSKGTKMPRGDKKQIMTYPVYLPSENELKNFNLAVLPMFQLIESNRRENTKLSLVRDTLLPKLMAGAVRFGDIES